MEDGKTIKPGLRRGIFAACCAALLSACAEEKPPPPPAVRPAKLMQVGAKPAAREVRLPAVVAASESSELSFAVGGLLEEISVAAGRRVARGEVVARLDREEFRNRQAAAQAEFAAAADEFERAERLLAGDAIARGVYEQRKARRDLAGLQLESARKSLDDAVLRAPFAGIAARVHVERFENVKAGEPIVTLQTVGAADAVVQAPAALVANARRIAAEASVVLDAAPGREIAAAFKSATTEADENTQSFAVKFSFVPPADLVILPGMTGAVKLGVTSGDGAAPQIAVPLAAIVSEGGARYVWVVDTAAMTVSRREIAVGAGVGETLLVGEGLAAGETIVAAGASRLHEGMKIRRYTP